MKPFKRLVEKTGVDDIVGIDLVFFSAGGLAFAVESVKVRTLRESEESEALSMAALLRLSEPAERLSSSRQWLLRLVHPSGMLMVRVDEPVTHDRLPTTALYPLPSLLEARLTLPCVRGLAYWRKSEGEALAIILDPNRLPVSFTPSIPTLAHEGRRRRTPTNWISP